jgi:hypothetical protein
LTPWSLDSRLWQSLQSGMYISAPPIKVWQFESAVLKVKDALSWHNLQIAESLITDSQRGNSSMMLAQD